MGGGSGSGGTATSTQTSQGTSTFAPWVTDAAQNLYNGAASNYGQNMQNAQNTANTGANQSQQAAGMLQGGYNQAQNASTYNPNTFKQNFMDPYTKDVVQANSNIAQRNFNQQAAPSLMSQMGAQGQFNSGRADQAMGMASAQNQQDINQINAGLMNQGYQQSQQNYLTSMGIGVQGANAMNQAGGQQGQLGLAGQLLPGQTFGQYSSGLAGLPLNKQQTQQTNTTQPVAGTGSLF